MTTMVHTAIDSGRAWLPIDTAPKDGRPILLLSAAQTLDLGLEGVWHREPRIAIGRWWADGTAWVDAEGFPPGTGSRMCLGKTGVWESGLGWFEPGEVTHWHPLPSLPAVLPVASPLTRNKEQFENHTYRHAYAEGLLFSVLATQLRVLREERGWTQGELAARIGSSQSQISAHEDINYPRWTLRFLLKLANAFDVYLRVRFEAFETLFEDRRRMDRASLQRPPWRKADHSRRTTHDAH